jgi:hypothetical protein
MRELGRMVAHEIGHCLTLEHADPHCIVFPNRMEANLMQQQRVFALQEWVEQKRCGCASSDCGDCKCPLDEDTYREVGESRKLDEAQQQSAMIAASQRDHLESSAETGFETIGNPVSGVDLAQPSSEKGILLEAGDVLVLQDWSTGSVYINRIRIKLAFAFPTEARFALWKFKSKACERVDRGSDSVAIDINFSLLGNSHLEVNLNDFHIDEGESLALELLDEGILRTRVRVAEHELFSGKFCFWKKSSSPEFVEKGILINYDAKILL